jgi:hypothetical protein
MLKPSALEISQFEVANLITATYRSGMSWSYFYLFQETKVPKLAATFDLPGGMFLIDFPWHLWDHPQNPANCGSC